MTYPQQIAKGRRTYWRVAPGVFQATMGEAPKSRAGYASLTALMTLKGESFSMISAYCDMPRYTDRERISEQHRKIISGEIDIEDGGIHRIF